MEKLGLRFNIDLIEDWSKMADGIKRVAIILNLGCRGGESAACDLSAKANNTLQNEGVFSRFTI